jgi:hypothetical protein
MTASPVAENDEVLIGVDVDATGANLVAMLNASSVNPKLAVVRATLYVAATNIMTLTYGQTGARRQQLHDSRSAPTSAVTFGGATLTGGVKPTAKRASTWPLASAREPALDREDAAAAPEGAGRHRSSARTSTIPAGGDGWRPDVRLQGRRRVASTTSTSWATPTRANNNILYRGWRPGRDVSGGAALM